MRRSLEEGLICVTWNMAEQHKKSLSRQVMEAIEKMIREREMGPGDVLPTETQIAEELSVSKSSVREAIKMLEALGVVEIRRGLCTVISENPEQGYLNVTLAHLYLTSGGGEELQTFRQTVEAAYTELAIDQATEEDKEQIAQALETFRENLHNGTLTSEDDLAFHSQILKATHNSFMISLGSALNELFRESIGVSIQTNAQLALADHEKICDAILRRDKSAAREAISGSAELWARTISIYQKKESK